MTTLRVMSLVVIRCFITVIEGVIMIVKFTVTIVTECVTDVCVENGWDEAITTPEAAARQYQQRFDDGVFALEDMDFEGAVVSVTGESADSV